MSSENSVDMFYNNLLENNMKHISHFLDKYEDVAEALKTTFIVAGITGLILGLAPMIMLMQWNSI